MIFCNTAPGQKLAYRASTNFFHEQVDRTLLKRVQTVHADGAPRFGCEVAALGWSILADTHDQPKSTV